MAKTKTTLKEGDNLPPRGKAKRTLILEAMERAGKTQDGFYDLLVNRALDPEDSFAFAELWKRFHPIEKAALPVYEFDYPKSGTMVQKADAVLDAVGLGCMPVDVAKYFIDIIDARASIEEREELAERVAKLEELLNK